MRWLTQGQEATISPAFVYVTSIWYTRDEIPVRTAVWYGGNGIGGILGSLIAFGIGQIKAPLHPWQWMFIVRISHWQCILELTPGRFLESQPVSGVLSSTSFSQTPLTMPSSSRKRRSSMPKIAFSCLARVVWIRLPASGKWRRSGNAYLIPRPGSSRWSFS